MELCPDSEIIDRVVHGGDVQAYGMLVQRYERGVLAAVLPVVRDLHAAQDVAQDAFVQAYLNLASLRDPARFGPWLLRIAGREAVRAARRGRSASLELAETHAVEMGMPLADDERRQLLDGVRRLPAHERAAVSLRYFDGLGVSEIARITGRPVGTVTKQLSRALQRLREDLLPESSTWQTNRSAIG